MSSFAQIGNDLYTGKRSVDFVGRQKTWYLISAILIALAATGLFGRHLNLGIEFRGGSEFRVSSVNDTQGFEQKAKDAVSSLVGASDVVVTTIGTDTIRVQTEQFEQNETDQVKASLASAFSVDQSKVSSSLIGPSWGGEVSRQAINALIVFLVLVSIVLAIYFRTWKMALSALIALIHDLVITVGIYALAGFEVTPASVIGFLTILGYSLYDTVVVFDKVRENTTAAVGNGRKSFSQAANSAVNQTLVRSINTSVVALLPVAAILVVGFTVIGPGTLLDISLALFVGIATGTYSSIFIATPLYADLREREPAMKDLRRRAERYQAARAKEAFAPERAHDGSVVEDGNEGPADIVGARSGAASATGGGPATGGGSATGAATASGRPVHPYAQTGPRNQPKRPPKSKR